MVGDGFGGRGWYKPHNYQVGAYSAFTVCGDSNQLYGWGYNGNGELADGTTNPAVAPVAATGMKNIKFYTTGYVSAAIKNDSTAWVWGNFPNSGFSSPAQVLTNVKFADGGISHAVFVKNDHTVWGVGRNMAGELGNGTVSDSPITTAVQMIGVSNAVRAIAVGYLLNAATFILLADSTVSVTGSKYLFPGTSITILEKIETLRNIIDIKGNAEAMYALNSQGEVFFYSPPNSNSINPTKITFPQAASPIIALSANNDGLHCLALDTNYNVYAWGENFHGQLGCGDTITKLTPVLVATNAVDIFAGENFSYILKTDNTLWASGQSGYSDHSATFGSIWMNLPNIKRNVFTQIDPTIPPMNLCAPKVFGVVPIKLSNFTCVANGNTANLNWQSAEESNASKYIVQYSNDGNSFKDIATVFATGSNSKYNFIHQQVNGTAFYRLMMMDKDGSFKYSEIRVVKFDNKAGVTIAPNPANDVLYVFAKNNASIKSIQIVSTDGQIIKVLNPYNSGQQINISTLASGTYILKAVYNNNQMEYGRLIKM